MLAYLICFSLFVSLLFVKNKRLYIPIFIIVFCVMGFRDMVGSMDIYNYAFSYEALYISEYFKYDSSEIGFQIYTAFLKLFSDNRYFYFFVTSFVLGFLQLFSSWVISEKDTRTFLFLSFIVLCRFYLLDFIVLKQMMSMGCIWLAFAYFYREKKRNALVFFILGLTFHRSSLILIPLLFLMNLRIDFKKTLITYGILLFLVVTGAVRFVTESLFELASMVTPYFSKVLDYFKVETEYKWVYLIEVPIIIILLYWIKQSKLSNHKKTALYNAIFWYGIFTIVSIMLPSLIRLSWFLFIAFALSLVSIWKEQKIINVKRAYVLQFFISLYFSMIFFRFLFFYYGGDMLPYKSIFDDFDRKGHFDHKEYRHKLPLERKDGGVRMREEEGKNDSK